MHHDRCTPPTTPRRRILRWLLLPIALVLAGALLLPLAQGTEVEESEGCAVTPGGWGAPPNGNNNGQLLHDNFDDVFGAQLTVGDLAFVNAQAVTDALPYTTGDGRAFKNHAVALEINIAFGDAELLDGTISDVEVQDSPGTDDDPYVGWTAEEVLAEAESLLVSMTDLQLQGHALIGVMTEFNEDRYGCVATAECDLDASFAVVSYTAVGTDGAEVFTSLMTADNNGYLEEDDMLNVTFTLGPNCLERLSIVSYEAEGPTFTLPQVFHDSDTGDFGEGTHVLGPIHIPDCFYQVDFVWGDVIIELTPTNLYGDRKIDWENGGENACVPPPNCPGGLTAIPNANGSIDLDWDEVDDAEEYGIYRGVDGGDLIFLDSTTDTEYTDDTVAVGSTYEYMITAFDGTLESEDCTTVVATAIPFFTAPILGAMALVGSVGAFRLLRRKP